MAILHLRIFEYCRTTYTGIVIAYVTLSFDRISQNKVQIFLQKYFIQAGCKTQSTHLSSCFSIGYYIYGLA